MARRRHLLKVPLCLPPPRPPPAPTAANTIELGHNTSVLLLGPRGAGKTLCVERALATVASRWNTDPADPLVAVVRLVGWAHADERVAFREIARQRCE